MSNDPNYEDPPEPKADVECDIGEMRALIQNSLRTAAFYVDHTPLGFSDALFRQHIERAEELASILADMLNPPRFQSNVPDDEMEF